MRRIEAKVREFKKTLAELSWPGRLIEQLERDDGSLLSGDTLARSCSLEQRRCASRGESAELLLAATLTPLPISDLSR